MSTFTCGSCVFEYEHILCEHVSNQFAFQLIVTTSFLDFLVNTLLDNEEQQCHKTVLLYNEEKQLNYNTPETKQNKPLCLEKCINTFWEA
jgi:hypothetical protein